MDTKNKFAAETVRQLRQSLEEVAPYQATELSKQQTIRALSPQILALRAKGYSWTAVAAMLSERGVPVSVAALRTYLRRVREEAPTDAPPTGAKRLRDRRVDMRPPPIEPLPSPGRETSPASNVTQQHGAAPSPAVMAPHAPSPAVSAPHATVTASRREREPLRATFVPPPDTDDL